MPPPGRSTGQNNMTLTYALIADGGIILAADSQVTHTHSVPDPLGHGRRVVGTYEGTHSKIRRIEKDSAFSVAGNLGLVNTLLARADNAGISPKKQFEELVKGYASAFCEVLFDERLQLAPRIEAAFLFCGYIGPPESRHPQIVKLDSAANFNYNPITDEGFAFTGSEEHGAVLYLHHRFYRPRMPLEQAKLLAYCIVAEVADQDNSVGGPIEVEVITPNGSQALRDSDIEKYEQARQSLIAKVRATLDEWV
jgi:20S proteasome alpha/beta subunit